MGVVMKSKELKERRKQILNHLVNMMDQPTMVDIEYAMYLIDIYVEKSLREQIKKMTKSEHERD